VANHSINFAPIEITGETTVLVGRQPYDHDCLDALRSEFSESHIVWIKLHFVPPYCPHLNPIERLWGVMHQHVTHNKCHATCAQFADATLGFLRE
jgi:transposase